MHDLGLWDYAAFAGLGGVVVTEVDGGSVKKHETSVGAIGALMFILACYNAHWILGIDFVVVFATVLLVNISALFATIALVGILFDYGIWKEEKNDN